MRRSRRGDRGASGREAAAFRGLRDRDPREWIPVMRRQTRMGQVPALLVVGDTFRSPEMRHEVPIGVPDAFALIETEGVRHAIVPALEAERVAALDGLIVHVYEELGWDDLLTSGIGLAAARREVVVNACSLLALRTAVVPAGFPLGYAERLREAGVELSVDQGVFDERRRVKSAAEIEGIRRAQRAAEAGMRACVDVPRGATGNGSLEAGGQPLTVELVKEHVEAAFVRHGASADELIVARGAQAARGHDMGSGPIARGESIVVDLWPRDRE